MDDDKNAVNLSGNSDPISLASKQTITISPHEGLQKASSTPSSKDYFNLATYLIYGTASLIAILSIISIFVSQQKTCATIDIIQKFLYPFLALMVGYVFGKGIPEK